MWDQDMGLIERWKRGHLQLHCARPSERHFGKHRLGLKRLNGFDTAEAKLLIQAGMERSGQRDTGSQITLDSTQAWLKGGRLSFEPALRHGLRRRLFGRAFPRINEFHNLGYLRASGIRAVRPLVAGLWSQALWPRLQFLATEMIPDAPSVATMIAEQHPDLTPALHACGKLVAALHQLPFEHRDCFPRNFVIDRKGRPWVLDAWRGGPCKSRPGARDVDDFIARVRQLGADPTAFEAGYASGPD